MKQSLTIRLLRVLPLTLTLCVAGSASTTFAQTPSDSENGIVMLEPLFEYPVAPEEIEGLSEKSEWLMAHFWDAMDFKSKDPLDQTKLNHAFGTYTTPMRFASASEVNKSISSLLKKLQKNPTLMLQFTIAAEENLYGNRADIWIDEVYMQFLDQALATKKIPERFKQRWSRQQKALAGSQVGMSAPVFDFTAADGGKHIYRPMATPTLLVFADAVDPQTRLGLLRSQSDTELSNMLTQGKVNVLFIDVVNPACDLSFLPSRCVGGHHDNSATPLPYDMRNLPSFYVIGGDGKITGKPHTLYEAIDMIKNQ